MTPCLVLGASGDAWYLRPMKLFRCVVWGGLSIASVAFAFACSTSEETTGATPTGADAGETPESPEADAASVPADAAAARKRVFVTSDYFPGHAFGGLAKMDAACNAVATRAKLGGTWKAWASDSKTSAMSRLADVGPWYTLEGKLVATNRAGLLTGLQAPISFNESGKRLTGFGNVWTGTLSDGGPSPNTCGDWAVTDAGLAPDGGDLFGHTGQANAPDSTWTDQPNVAACYGSALSLYCFEQ